MERCSTTRFLAGSGIASIESLIEGHAVRTLDYNCQCMVTDWIITVKGDGLDYNCQWFDGLDYNCQW